jgi:hypothetical protein
MDRPVLKYIVAVFIIQFITACGGGSSTNSGPISPPQDGELLFQSGFEPNVVFANRSAEAGTIQGIDQSVSPGINDWDKLPNYLDWMATQISYVEGGNLALVQDPTDPTNRVLQLKNTREENGRTRSQWSLYQADGSNHWVPSGTPNKFDKQFYRIKMFIPAEIETLYSFSEWSRWYMIWESHAWAGDQTRHGVYIKKESNSNHWYFQVVQESPEGYQNVLFENTANQDVAVPFGEWFTFDVFFKHHDTNGEFYVAITTDDRGHQQVANYRGKTKNGNKLHDQMMFKLYHDTDILNRMQNLGFDGTTQYYDDFEIWSNFPPWY